MARFESPVHPSLRVSDLGLKFLDGVLEVDGESQAARLRELSDFGVIEVVPEKPPANKPASKK